MGEEKYKMITFSEGGLALDVRVDPNKETIWLTQAEMAELFGVDRTRVGRHLKNIFGSAELDKKSTCAESAQVHQEGKRREGNLFACVPLV